LLPDVFGTERDLRKRGTVFRNVTLGKGGAW
jgi:hypothetical protein